MINFPQFQENQERDTDYLVKEIEDLKRRLDSLELNKEITIDLPIDQKDAIRDIIVDRLAESVWTDFFYISQSDPVGAVMTGGDVANEGETNEQMSLSITKESRLRVVFNILALGTGTVYFTTAHVRPVDVGYDISDVTGEYVGIKMNGTTMSGLTSKKGKQSETVLKTGLATGDDYVIEIKFFPGDRVDFFVNYQLAGSIASNLPSDDDLEIFEWWYMEIPSGSTQIDVQRLEFMQKNK